MPPIALIVDDEPHILRVAELALKTIGCVVELARDGEQAWQAIQRNQPDILISDVQMPNMDGLQLVRRIRGTPDLVALPIILLTAKGFELQQFEVELIGPGDIIAKPFSPTALAKRVYELLSAQVRGSATHS